MSTRRRLFSRRALLVGCGGVLGCCVVAGGGLGAWVYFANDPVSNVGELEFNNRVAIPPLLEPAIDERRPQGLRPDHPDRGDADRAGRARRDLGHQRSVPGADAARHAAATRWRSRSTTSCRRTPRSTGTACTCRPRWTAGRTRSLPVGETWQPAWTIDQPASTLWYHPHPHGETAEHVYRGVAGLFLLDDDETDALQLPREYGVDDVPLDHPGQEVHRRRRPQDGRRLVPRVTLGGRGSSACWATRSSSTAPTIRSSRSRATLTRFRLLNGSNARFYNLGFADDRPFRLVATENGFVPETRSQLDAVAARTRRARGDRRRLRARRRRGPAQLTKQDLGDSSAARSAPTTPGTSSQFRAASAGAALEPLAGDVDPWRNAAPRRSRRARRRPSSSR